MPTLVRDGERAPWPGVPAGLGALVGRLSQPAPKVAAEPELVPVPPEEEPAPPFELAGVTCLAAVPERATVPLDLGEIPLVLPRADVTLAFGQGAIGKGRMTWAVIAAVTNAGGDVIVVLPEDKEDEAMAERGRAAGADMTRVWNMTKLPGSAARFKLSAAERHEGHIGYLRGFIETLKANGRKPRLVVIDPVSAVVGWGTMLQVAGARRLVEPLQDMADQTGVAVLCIGHATKDGKLAGSAGLAQALRLVYRVSVDPVNSACRVITVEKANNLPPGVDGLRFTITADERGRARVEWLGKEAADRQRTAWREEDTTPVAPARMAARGGSYMAAFAPHGGPAVTLGAHPTPAAAESACRGHAGEPLTWRPSRTQEGTQIATSARGGYSVSAPAE